MKKHSLSILLIPIILSITSCAMLNSFVGDRVQKPQVSFVSAKLDGLSFDRANLLFDLQISNPNSVGLKMAGFDYDLLINNNSFIKGNQQKNLQIAPKGQSTVQLPLSVSFVELYQTYQSLKNQDTSMYQINCGFSFDVPVLGVVNIPVSKSGEFPLLKIPKISLDELKLENVSLTGAELNLGVAISNPNAFSMILKKIQYQFDVNNLNWISGEAKEGMQILEKGQGTVDIPITLNFIEMGRSVYQLIRGNKAINYKFGGNVDLNTSVPLLGQVNLPFDKTGTVNIVR
ncbi:hypothetical protein GF312_12745 [Candidatus Poribacteria bacterium]|nr:hypothetical protein [Candidatus Poribacteria bacterium]